MKYLIFIHNIPPLVGVDVLKSIDQFVIVSQT